MVNDRGSIKWTALMLPEHVEMLRALDEEEKNIERPILSEDKLAEMEKVLQQAMEYKQLLNLEYFHNKRILSYKGVVTSAGSGKLRMVTEDGIEYLTIKNVVDIQVSEY